MQRDGELDELEPGEAADWHEDWHDTWPGDHSASS